MDVQEVAFRAVLWTFGDKSARIYGSPVHLSVGIEYSGLNIVLLTVRIPNCARMWNPPSNRGRPLRVREALNFIIRSSCYRVDPDDFEGWGRDPSLPMNPFHSLHCPFQAFVLPLWAQYASPPSLFSVPPVSTSIECERINCIRNQVASRQRDASVLFGRGCHRVETHAHQHEADAVP